MLLFAFLTNCKPVAEKADFEQERQQRIKKDFTKTEAEVKAFIQEYIPGVTNEQIKAWEDSKALEMMVIDGEKRYFKYAARNLFRIDKQCREIWKEAHPDASAKKEFDLNGHAKEVIQAVKETSEKYVKPVRFRITYSISVPANSVPAGETIRCWIPYPIEIENRQTDIKYIDSQPNEYQLAPADQLQRTIYFEQKSAANTETVFKVTYEFTGHGTYTEIDPKQVLPVESTDGLDKYLAERPPHIVFDEELHQLSQEIIGEETNPYFKAQKLFKWVDENIPWASAREYSTIKNIPKYAFQNGHGDCGIQTLLFITLCRMNGIPARWQSGWEFQPPANSMHDWGMIYFKPYGWMPMDVTYGLRDTDDEALKWFYLHGMDSYRLIFNEDYEQDFVPKKQHFRSETVDSQRGEVEWDGGNLYFGQWNWDFDWEIISQ